MAAKLDDRWRFVAAIAVTVVLLICIWRHWIY